jgi:hypothetical protein
MFSFGLSFFLFVVKKNQSLKYFVSVRKGDLLPRQSCDGREAEGMLDGELTVGKK